MISIDKWIQEAIEKDRIFCITFIKHKELIEKPTFIVKIKDYFILPDKDIVIGFIFDNTQKGIIEYFKYSDLHIFDDITERFRLDNKTFNQLD